MYSLHIVFSDEKAAFKAGDAYCTRLLSTTSPQSNDTKVSGNLGPPVGVPASFLSVKIPSPEVDEEPPVQVVSYFQ